MEPERIVFADMAELSIDRVERLSASQVPEQDCGKDWRANRLPPGQPCKSLNNFDKFYQPARLDIEQPCARAYPSRHKWLGG
jgi:hypothetical protein